MSTGAEIHERFLRLDHAPEQLRELLADALERVPGAVGVSTHMGSRLTADHEAMAALMPTLRARGLVFFDSLTTPHSQAGAAAEAAGVPWRARDVFLDVDLTPAKIRGQLELAAEWAQERPVVVVAHPSPEVVEVLRDGLPRLHAAGIGIYSLREILARQPQVRAQ